MIRRLYYLLVTPKLFERSALRHPRACCAFFLLVASIPLIVALPFLISMPYPWGAITFIAAILATAGALLLWQIQHEQIRHAWNYLRGTEKEFWRFNKG